MRGCGGFLYELVGPRVGFIVRAIVMFFAGLATVYLPCVFTLTRSGLSASGALNFLRHCPCRAAETKKKRGEPSSWRGPKGSPTSAITTRGGSLHNPLCVGKVVDFFQGSAQCLMPVLIWICDGRHDEEIARFVFESDDIVTDVVIGARDELRILTRYKYLGFAATLAAASDGVTDALKAAIEALYLHLRHDYQLIYELEPGFNPTTGEQRVRNPADVSRHNGGTCIDLVLLFLSCLAFPKLRPIYVQLRSGSDAHGLAGVWLKEPPPAAESFLLLNDLSSLHRKATLGHLLLVDCTGFTEGHPQHENGLTFLEAQNTALSMLADIVKIEQQAKRRRHNVQPRAFGFVLDVMTAWDAGFYPIRTQPARGQPLSDASLQKGPVPEALRDHFAYPFNAFIVSRTRRFVGRDFVFQELDAFLSKERSGYFVIRGKPGIGKSALIAQLVKTRGCVHHFNIALQGIDTASQFLNHVCAQIIVRFRLPYVTLPEDSGNNGRFLARLLEEASRKLEGTERLVVAIDALDEVQHESGTSNVLFLPPESPGRYLHRIDNP